MHALSSNTNIGTIRETMTNAIIHADFMLNI